MSIEANKVLVRGVLEALFQGDFTPFDEHPGLAEIKQTITQAALARVYQQHGDDESAQYALARGTEIVQALAGKMDTDDLRARFLSAAARYLGIGFRVAGSARALS